MDTQSTRNKKIQMNCMNKECRARIVGTCLDGIRCPVCDDYVKPAPYDGMPGHIDYNLYKKNNRPKQNKGLAIEVSADTDNLSAKLRAISKHAAALANELDEIDRDKCPNCGKAMSKTTMYGDGVPSVHYECINCGIQNGLDFTKEGE